MLPGQLCLSVVDTERQREEGVGLAWSAGMAHCSQEHIRWGSCLSLTDGGREDLALNPGATQSREYAGDVTSRDTGCCPETHPGGPLAASY